MDFSIQSIVQHHTAQMDSAFRNLIETITQHSKLNISLLRISNVTEDSFHVSMEACITKTGPVSASISPMTVDLHGPAGQFGKVTLPPIKTRTRVNGTEVVVTSQLVHIIDKEALQAFIRAIIEGSTAVLSLRNGHTSITALGIAPREIVYEKEIELPGMKGPTVSVTTASINQNLPQDPSLSPMPGATQPGNAPLARSQTTASMPFARSQTSASISSTLGLGGNNVSVGLQVINPSPLEISFGTCSFEIRDHAGRLLAELKGRLDIRRSYFEVTVQGSVHRSVAARLAAEMRDAANKTCLVKDEKSEKRAPGAWLVGKRCVGAGWCDETVKSINVPIRNMGILFRALGLNDNVDERPEKRSSFTKWTSRWSMR
ncbi:hypothetical protein F4861DRAFT_533822 [Xylaria intraflava]|nr:hypothetical protein F4861DRAFT_533822 [Xylaria intraflava]